MSGNGPGTNCALKRMRTFRVSEPASNTDEYHSLRDHGVHSEVYLRSQTAA